MQPSYGITFIFLFAIKPFVFSYAAPTNASANVTKGREMSSQTTSTPLMPTTEATYLSSTFTIVLKDGINNSATDFNRNSTSSSTFTIPGDFSRVTTNAAANSTGLPSTVTPSNSTVTKGTHSAAALPSYTSSINPTTFPISTALTSPMVKQDSPTTNFNTIQHTTELNYNFTNTSTISSNPEGTNEEKTNKGGVIFGVTVGAILGSILIGLIGYFICGKKRSESFSHRRLYDDTRNDPVLHLDNSLGPYDTSFGSALGDQTSTADKAEGDNAGCPGDGIPMADMTPSHPAP
ncbi:mucin-15 [Anser cygnoides]|uniref:mucin-15 n=2 Tax=Anserinae TaxID=2068722 RepID=UPI0034D1B02F